MTKDTYHHGNLRRALMDQALSLIAEKGVGALSLREVAARVGVSHAAPYHHFADKTALLRSLAYEGMRLLDDRMAAAEQAADGAKARLLAIGSAYVLFAAEHPEYYATFTSPESSGPGAVRAHDEIEEEHGSTWERLMGGVIACQQTGDIPPGDPLIYAISMWSLVHGLAELWRIGPLSFMPQASEGLEPLANRVLLAALGSMSPQQADEDERARR